MDVAIVQGAAAAPAPDPSYTACSGRGCACCHYVIHQRDKARQQAARVRQLEHALEHEADARAQAEARAVAAERQVQELQQRVALQQQELQAQREEREQARRAAAEAQAAVLEAQGRLGEAEERCADLQRERDDLKLKLQQLQLQHELHVRQLREQHEMAIRHLEQLRDLHRPEQQPRGVQQQYDGGQDREGASAQEQGQQQQLLQLACLQHPSPFRPSGGGGGRVGVGDGDGVGPQGGSGGGPQGSRQSPACPSASGGAVGPWTPPAPTPQPHPQSPGMPHAGSPYQERPVSNTGGTGDGFHCPMPDGATPQKLLALDSLSAQCGPLAIHRGDGPSSPAYCGAEPPERHASGLPAAQGASIAATPAAATSAPSAVVKSGQQGLCCIKQEQGEQTGGAQGQPARRQDEMEVEGARTGGEQRHGEGDEQQQQQRQLERGQGEGPREGQVQQKEGQLQQQEHEMAILVRPRGLRRSSVRGLICLTPWRAAEE